MKAQYSVSRRIESDIRKFCRETGIRTVLVALSGGPDSMASLIACHEAGLSVIALHCNFHLRNEESNRDSKHCVDVCKYLDVPILVKDFDVLYYLNNHKGCSVEMACRILRYEWFFNKLEELNADRLVTGHNADDNIETLFLNLLRGSGTNGLKGMLPDANKIWRPLLSIHREMILEYLKEKNISYIIDSSNLSSDFRRNFLRNKVIPLLKSEWKGFDNALDTSIKYLRSENDIINEAILSILKNDPEYLDADLITKFPAPELLLNRYLKELGPVRTIPGEICDAIRANKPHARVWNCKNGKVILRNKRLYKFPLSDINTTQ